jgi:hypothetical protein
MKRNSFPPLPLFLDFGPKAQSACPASPFSFPGRAPSFWAGPTRGQLRPAIAPPPSAADKAGPPVGAALLHPPTVSAPLRTRAPQPQPRPRPSIVGAFPRTSTSVKRSRAPLRSLLPAPVFQSSSLAHAETAAQPPPEPSRSSSVLRRSPQRFDRHQSSA